MTQPVINPPAIVRSIDDDASESKLVAVCRELLASIDDSKWQIGRLAHAWTQRYANGRTDEDFGKLIGLPQQQVNQRRLVWATFGDVYHTCGKLGWSHFREVLNWDDAEEWLAEANDNKWSVATMKRMRDVRQRMQHGEDLTQPADEQPEQWERSDESTEGEFLTEGAVRNDGDQSRPEGAGPEKESPVVQDDDEPDGVLRSARPGTPQPPTVSTPGSARPQRIDNAAKEFHAACQKLSANVRQFIAAARRDDELRMELESVLLTLLEEIRNQ